MGSTSLPPLKVAAYQTERSSRSTQRTPPAMTHLTLFAFMTQPPKKQM